MIKLQIILIFFLFGNILLAQTPPQFRPVTPHDASGINHTRLNTNPFATHHALAHQRQQQAARVRQQNQAIIQKNQNRRKTNQEAIKELRQIREQEVQYEFASLSHIRGTQRYYEAYTQLVAMLQENRVLSLKDAIFLVEQAYVGEKLQREWYDNEIAKSVGIIRGEMKNMGYSMGNMLGKKMLLHAFMSGSLGVRDNTGKTIHSTTPKRYDFDDIYGEKDWTKMFVTKLMQTNTGQCHSMPLLYLILAEELQIEAYLALSPAHSYIKLKDGMGNWFNLELTNGHYSTDIWLLSSGYVKAEAVKNGLYMRPLSKKETIAHCLIDLVMGYIHKYGYDAFVLQCVEKALEYSPKHISALQLRANYHTYLFEYIAKQLGTPPVNVLPAYPKAYTMYKHVCSLHQHLNNLGYEYIPEEIYEKWLQSLEEKKHLQAKFPRP